MSKIKPRRGRKLAVGFFAVALLVWGGWAWWRDSRYRMAMEEVESQVVQARYVAACRNLEALLAWKADTTGGIHYLLGACELARDRKEAAEKAWANVAPGSEFSERTIRARMRLLHDAGRLADAERLINDAAADTRNDRTAMMVALVPIFIDLGRTEEATRLIEDRWQHLNSLGQGMLEPAIKLVLQHVDVTMNAPTVEAVRSLLEQATRIEPNDDRIWLGRANLAIRLGDYKDAERWLDACEKLRTNDPAVWRARLNWALATDRVDFVEQAYARRSELGLREAEVYRLDAWLARHRGDLSKERVALDAWLQIEPYSAQGLDRLVELARNDGQAERAAESLSKKAKGEVLVARYRKLHGRTQPIRHAEELAHLAGELGRAFEAHGFLTVAVAQEPRRKDLKAMLENLSRHKNQ